MRRRLHLRPLLLLLLLRLLLRRLLVLLLALFRLPLLSRARPLLPLSRRPGLELPLSHTLLLISCARQRPVLPLLLLPLPPLHLRLR